MKVKILKSTGSSYWYNSKIGETFEVIQDPERSDSWKVLDESEGWRMIDKVDAEIIDEAVLSNKLFEIVPEFGEYRLQVKDEEAFKSAASLNPIKCSIKKWELLVQGIGKFQEYINERGTSTCGLCQQYYFGGGRSCCVDCPVYKETGRNVCQDTPYQKYAALSRSASGKDIDPIKAYAYAAQEYFFLKSLQ